MALILTKWRNFMLWLYSIWTRISYLSISIFKICNNNNRNNAFCGSFYNQFPPFEDVKWHPFEKPVKYLVRVAFSDQSSFCKVAFRHYKPKMPVIFPTATANKNCISLRQWFLISFGSSPYSRVKLTWPKIWSWIHKENMALFDTGSSTQVRM